MEHTQATDTELIEAFAAHQKVRGFSPRTVARRTWSLTHLATAGPLSQHNAVTIETFMARWESPQSRYSVRSDCHQFYRWAIRRELLAVDPTDNVDPPRIPRRAATPVSVTDLRRAIIGSNEMQRRAIMLGAYAGLRCSEIGALEAADIHHDRGILVVRHGKGGHGAVVPLAPQLAMVLPRSGSAVCYPNGSAVGKAIRSVFRRLGIDARPHDLRHTFGTAVAERSNGNMVLTASLMRHASIETTQRYVGWAPDGSDVVADLFSVRDQAA